MFPASCILLCFTCIAATYQFAITYVKPSNPFRRSIIDCEMCYKGDCFIANGPRCEYYADASKLLSDVNGEEFEKQRESHIDTNEIDTMLFELVNSASPPQQFMRCIPLVSQYTDCTEENICIGCKFCSCTEDAKWICKEKQKCRSEPKLIIDHRVIGIVIENLKKKEITHERRVKRSSAMNTTRNNVEENITFMDIAKWVYGVNPVHYKAKKIGVENTFKYHNDYGKSFNEYKDEDRVNFTTTVTDGPVFLVSTLRDKGDNYIDLLEFNDILQSWTTNDLSTRNPVKLFDLPHTFDNRHLKEIHINDNDYSEYDPIRFIKRDVSKFEGKKSPTILQINSTTNNNVSYELVFIDALKSLNKITNEKQKELEELVNIQNNLLSIAKAHNISIDINSTTTDQNINQHQIAIYKVDSYEKCAAEVKHSICSAIEDVLKTVKFSNSSNLHRDLKLIISTIKKYMLHDEGNTNSNMLSSQEYHEDTRKYIDQNNIYQLVNPIKRLGNILVEINKAPANPLYPLSPHASKILKRVIKQLYLDNIAIIDHIVHETYYDFDGYLEGVGSKWNKMTQDIIDSEHFDTLYRVKLLYLTLREDISKIEDMITLLDFARNRRMTIANGVTLDKSILRIQNNLQLINNNVQKIRKLENEKKLRQTPLGQKSKPAKNKSILQKLKKMFQTSKKDIKEMLRKRFPKSEILKQIAKKKIDELETRRMLEYQETMKQWQDNLNLVSGRDKRAAWDFRAIADRIKSIIPGYLRGKVKPAMEKKSSNKTHMKNLRGKTIRRYKKPTTIKTTFAKIN